MPTKWTPQTAREVLERDGQAISQEGPTGNGLGVVLRTEGGAIVNVFKTGKVSVQGQHSDYNKALFGLNGSAATTSKPPVTQEPDRLAELIAKLSTAGLEVTARGVALKVTGGAVVVLSSSGRVKVLDANAAASDAVRAVEKALEEGGIGASGGVTKRQAAPSGAGTGAGMQAQNRCSGPKRAEVPMSPDELAAFCDPIPF